MIDIGILAKMYGQLPSNVLQNGTLYDIVVSNALAEWENQSKSSPNLSQDEMIEMIKRVKK